MAWTALIQLGAWVFYVTVALLVAGRLGLIIVKLVGARKFASKWARTFNTYTEYLQY